MGLSTSKIATIKQLTEEEYKRYVAGKTDTSESEDATFFKTIQADKECFFVVLPDDAYIETIDALTDTRFALKMIRQGRSLCKVCDFIGDKVVRVV